jgi:hypothetical protein
MGHRGLSRVTITPSADQDTASLVGCEPKASAASVPVLKLFDLDPGGARHPEIRISGLKEFSPLLF